MHVARTQQAGQRGFLGMKITLRGRRGRHSAYFTRRLLVVVLTLTVGCWFKPRHDGDTSEQAMWRLYLRGAWEELCAIAADASGTHDTVNRINALHYIERLGNNRPEIVNVVLQLVEDKDSVVRYKAVSVLGALKAEGVISRLADALDDNVYSAIESLGLIGGDEAILILWGVVRAEGRADMEKAMAAAALWRLGERDPELWTLLYTIIDGDFHPICVTFPLMALTGDEMAISVLERCVLGDAEILEKVGAKDDKERRTVRSMALFALGERGKLSLRIIGECEEDLGAEAVYYLGRICEDEVAGLLSAALESTDPIVRRNAVRVCECLRTGATFTNLLQKAEEVGRN